MEDEKITINVTKDEFAYLVGFLNATYNQMCKLPKKLRGNGFEIMEKLTQNQFSAFSNK